MASCERQDSCVFYTSVEPSVLKRIKYASAFPFCRGGQHEVCALYEAYSQRRPVPDNLLPNGTIGEYLDAVSTDTSGRVVVVEDSPVFMRIAANIVRNALLEAEVVECASFSEAARALEGSDVSVVVSGYGLDGGRSARDLRSLTDAHIVILTGRPEAEIVAPVNSSIVFKAAGPDALKSAILSVVGA